MTNKDRSRLARDLSLFVGDEIFFVVRPLFDETHLIDGAPARNYEVAVFDS